MPRSAGARLWGVQAFYHKIKPWRKAEFISAAQVQTERDPAPLAEWESNVQNPVYITTVWGYGYKWGF